MAHNISAALVRRGHDVRVQTVGIKPLPKQEILDGVEIFRTWGFRRRPDLCTVPEMLGFLLTSFLPSLVHIRKWRPDIIHAHFAVPTGVLAFFCQFFTGVPYVITAHLGDLPGGNPEQTDTLFQALDPLILPIWKQAAGLSASSSFAAELAAAAYEVSPRVILNGISMDGIAPRARPPGDPLRLVGIGRFHPQKNFPWLVRMLAGCAFPWHLDLVGDGNDLADIQAAIRETRLENKIHLRGWLPESEMREVLSHSDILVMPSTSEGNPLAAIEALKQGLAIVGSDVGGLSDLIANEDNGFALPLVPALFQKKLAWLQTHPAALLEMKTRSLARAQLFDLEKIAAGFEELLLEASQPACIEPCLR
jgi:glycosyltransferase involved in cell wall biosynthesis